jgi:hypothetical protein
VWLRFISSDKRARDHAQHSPPLVSSLLPITAGGEAVSADDSASLRR